MKNTTKQKHNQYCQIRKKETPQSFQGSRHRKLNQEA